MHDFALEKGLLEGAEEGVKLQRETWMRFRSVKEGGEEFDGTFLFNTAQQIEQCPPLLGSSAEQSCSSMWRQLPDAPCLKSSGSGKSSKSREQAFQMKARAPTCGAAVLRHRQR